MATTIEDGPFPRLLNTAARGRSCPPCRGVHAAVWLPASVHDSAPCLHHLNSTHPWEPWRAGLTISSVPLCREVARFKETQRSRCTLFVSW